MQLLDVVAAVFGQLFNPVLILGGFLVALACPTYLAAALVSIPLGLGYFVLTFHSVFVMQRLGFLPDWRPRADVLLVLKLFSSWLYVSVGYWIKTAWQQRKRRSGPRS